MLTIGATFQVTMFLKTFGSFGKSEDGRSDFLFVSDLRCVVVFAGLSQASGEKCSLQSAERGWLCTGIVPDP
jgi:hypothetical protein